MRRAIGLFGMIAGAIVVALVARYGFVTSDTTTDGAIVAFFFAVIAIGGIAGPAVAVHLWRNSKGLAKLWGLAAGAIALVALAANLSNSLGAITTRADKTLAERAKIATAVEADKAELHRLLSQRASMPAFEPVTAEAVLALQQAVGVAADVRASECKIRRSRCREREADEAALRTELTAALAAKALSDRAQSLEDGATDVRARLAVSPPVASTNPLADTLGRLFALPAELAATWQQVATVIVVELLIAFALIAFELLRLSDNRKLPIAASSNLAPDNTLASENMLVPNSMLATGDVRRFMLACLPRARGKRESWGQVYAAYRDWCSRQSPPAEPLGLTEFGNTLQALCDRVRVKTENRDGRLYCVGVKLAN